MFSTATTSLVISLCAICIFSKKVGRGSPIFPELLRRYSHLHNVHISTISHKTEVERGGFKQEADKLWVLPFPGKSSQDLRRVRWIIYKLFFVGFHPFLGKAARTCGGYGGLFISFYCLVSPFPGNSSQDLRRVRWIIYKFLLLGFTLSWEKQPGPAAGTLRYVGEVLFRL